MISSPNNTGIAKRMKTNPRRESRNGKNIIHIAGMRVILPFQSLTYQTILSHVVYWKIQKLDSSMPNMCKARHRLNICLTAKIAPTCLTALCLAIHVFVCLLSGNECGDGRIMLRLRLRSSPFQ